MLYYYTHTPVLNVLCMTSIVQHIKLIHSTQSIKISIICHTIKLNKLTQAHAIQVHTLPHFKFFFFTTLFSISTKL